MMRISRAWVVGFIIKLSSSKEKGSRRKNWEKCLATALPMARRFLDSAANSTFILCCHNRKQTKTNAQIDTVLQHGNAPKIKRNDDLFKDWGFQNPPTPSARIPRDTIIEFGIAENLV
jgi:hypothetical protein